MRNLLKLAVLRTRECGVWHGNCLQLLEGCQSSSLWANFQVRMTMKIDIHNICESRGMRLCWRITFIIIKQYEGDSRAKKKHTKSVFLWVLSPYWPHKGINIFVSDNVCSTLNLELNMEKEWHCEILKGHNSGWNIQVYNTRARIQFYYAEREKLSFILLQLKLHWHFTVQTIIWLLATADIIVIYRNCSNC